MAARRAVKKNIKEDQLVTWAVRLSGWTQEHFVPITVGVVVFVVAVVAVIFTANSRQGADRQAGRQVASAMSLLDRGDLNAARTTLEQVAGRYGGKYGALAEYFRAEAEFRQANYDDAIKGYDEYLKQSDKFPLFRVSAKYARALCFEGRQDYASAAQALEELLGELDKTDPRYFDAAMHAGEFFAKSGDNASGAKYYRVVSEGAEETLAERARVAAALLDG